MGFARPQLVTDTAVPVVQRDCGCGGSCADCAEKDRLVGSSAVRLGPRDDAFEQEADRVADAVMSGGTMQPQADGEEMLQRQPEEEEEELQLKPEEVQRQSEEEEEEMIQPKAAGTGAARGSVPVAVQTVASGGAPLPAAERAFFEPRFGRDLSHVRIHADAGAATAAKGIGARAYTLRNHVAFGPGQYNPGSTEGRRLMAHELTHTLQQGAHGRATIRRDCESDQRKCRDRSNWSDGGHWIGTGPEPDCNCGKAMADARAGCRNSANWSDGGHWIGSGPEPDCSLQETVRRTISLTYEFPTNACVQKFNQGRNQIATHVSTGAGIVVGTGALLLSRNPAIAESASATTTVGVASIVVGAATNEVLGGMPQTSIGVGYSWRRSYTIEYTRSAHPWGAEGAHWSMTSEVMDENGDLVNGMSFAENFRDSQLRSIMQLIPLLTDAQFTVSCPDANALSM